MTTLTEFIARIEEYTSKATKGPWTVESDIGQDIFADRTRIASADPRWNFSPGKASCFANLSFTASARTDIEKLVKLVRVLEDNRIVTKNCSGFGDLVRKASNATEKKCEEILNEK